MAEDTIMEAVRLEITDSTDIYDLNKLIKDENYEKVYFYGDVTRIGNDFLTDD